MLSRLVKIEEERLQKQRRAKEQERQEAKKGAPENLSKELLKEILTEHGITFKKSSTKIELINKVMDLRIQLQRQVNETTAIENDGPAETADETIAVTHRDEPICDFAFSPVFNQVFHKPSETKQKSAYKQPTHSAKSRMIPCVLYFFDERYEKKNHYHVTHCFSSCAVFAFLRCIYDSLYYGVVALSNIPKHLFKSIGTFSL